MSIMSNNNGDVNIFAIDPIPVKPGEKIYFKADVDKKNLQFSYGSLESSLKKVGPVLDMMLLTDENSNGFTGAYVGMCCNDPGTRSNYADFDFFEYIEKE